MLSDTNESRNVPQQNNLHDVNNELSGLSSLSGYSSGYDSKRIEGSDQVVFVDGETSIFSGFSAIPAAAFVGGGGVGSIGTHFICPIINTENTATKRKNNLDNIGGGVTRSDYFIPDTKTIINRKQERMERKIGRLSEGRSFNDIRQDEYETVFRNRGGGGDGSSSNKNDENDFNREQSTHRGYGSITNDYKNLNKTCSNEAVTNLGKKQEMSTGHIFSEDMRISKMLRRLCGETNPKSANELCEKLQIVIMDSSNTAYIRRAFDFLAESIISILHQGPIESLDNVSKVFGMLGYVIRNDFPVYKNWIVRNYESSKHIRIYLMKALKVTIEYDAKTLDLINYSDRILLLLKDWLEGADIVDHFIAVSDVVAEFAKNYKKSFERHFTDIVDIVVGWHLETEQSVKLKQHCSYVLQQFSEFFIKKFDFTTNLLGQFLEDIIAFGEDIESSKIQSGTLLEHKSLPEISVGSFIGAFVSVIKCLATDREIIAFKLNKTIFNDACKIITQIALKSLKITTSQETVQSINEFFVIILMHDENIHKNLQRQVQYDENKIYQIIKIQINTINKFNKTQIDSLLYLMIIYVNTLKANTPIDMITFCLNTKECKYLSELKFSTNKKHYKLLIKFYHKILTIKNVPLLQEAYKYILLDMKIAMKCLKNEIKKDPSGIEKEISEYSVKQAECVLTFYFSAIAILATQTSSIIGMYALQPSILELLINELNASKMEIWSYYPTLHDALITLLSVHCIKNHNYIRSSNILMTNVFSKLSLDDTSPTSENFTIILKFFVNILSSSTATTHYGLSEKTTLLILDWIHVIYDDCIQYANILKNHSSFTQIGKYICLLSIQTQSLIISKECAKCIQKILKYNEINQQILTAIAETCCTHIFSTNSMLQELYSKIFAKLPFGISLRQSYESTGLFKQHEIKLNEMQYWYVSSQTPGNLREKYFKYFIEKISIPTITTTNEEKIIEEIVEIQKIKESSIEQFVKDIFPKCWTFQSGRVEEYCKIAQSDWNCLIAWLQWEAAQYCVNNKLRTSLGKPQETFLKIEAILKEYARILALKGDSNVKCIQTLVSNQKNARVLLGFIECLEKAIYNAAEGTAFAIPAPEKPARTFFRVNTSTCNEWFSRIRTAINLIALHTMEPEMVIRNSEVMLQILVATNRTSESLFEHTLMSMVWALLKSGEAETLHGLYIWTKKISGKRVLWIKYAAEHAAGHREKAVEGYMNVISLIDDKVDGSIREFLFEQIIDCLYFTSQWDDLKEFLTNEYKISNEQRSTSPLMSLTPSQIESIINLEQGNSHRTLLELSDWDIFEEDREELSNNFSCHKLLSLTENTLVNIALNKKDEPNAIKQLKICTSVIYSGLQQCLRTKSKEYLNNFIILNNIMNQITESQQNSNSNSSDSKLITNSIPPIGNHKVYGSVTLIRIMRWLNLLQPTKCLDSLNLQVIALARKEGNLKFCQQELEKFFKQKKTFNALAELVNCSTDENFEQICNSVIDLNSSVWTNDVLHGVTEIGKCWFSTGNSVKQENAIQLVSSCCLSAIQNGPKNNGEISERLARIMLTLADWLSQGNNDIVQNMNNKPVQKLLTKLPNIEGYSDEKANSVISTADAAVGKLICASSRQHSNLAKAWGALGNWFYRWGRKIVELRTDSHADKAGLRADDIEAIKRLLPSAIENDIGKIVKILNRHQLTAEDEEIGANDISSTELIENQLREIDLLKDIESSTILSIIQIWKQAHKSVYRYYEMAADSYFKYLNLATSYAIEKENLSDENEDQGDCSIVTATLRLLRLVVKHAIGLQEVLEEGLATTPTKPWKVIIPQLFSRLNHHESYVRKRVSELLCRVAEDSPHLIIFPAVVGSIQEDKTDCVSLKTVSSDAKETEVAGNSPLIFCFSSLLDTLSKQAPETVEQVQTLVKELKRVTLLWDEFWLHSLAQLYSEYLELFNTLESEVRQSSEDRLELLTEKHRILMSYVAEDMQNLQNITSRPPETNYERNFQEKYSKIIETTIESIKKPLNYEKPNESWQKIKQLYALFQQKLQKSSQLSLKMADISPILANMKNTAISMPGVETGENNPIYIKSVDNIVHILPTKTKPKKLAFFGSDGKRYTYLFKGLEDLHLDERIMQFLSISNSMMSKSNEFSGNSIAYRAHHYSVIPLGPRSGLISWVDGVTPIFALYKKWQQREAANPKKDKQYTAMRPSELFYNKLAPLLAEHNIKTTDNRKTWPISVLRKVLEELSNETPRDLLAKELWCHSNNAAMWRKAIRTYSLSVAVMSVIGYVIGLGDRHLDNVLVKLSTGDIVHIDYNVCFEKGKTLRVPEKVPFRMTPNLEEALGITGIEGTFRLACEHVLKTLRKERETLLTLLEAFVYDPLVDWTMSDDGSTSASSIRTTKALCAAADIAALGNNIISTSSSTTSGLIEGNSNAMIVSTTTTTTTTVGGGGSGDIDRNYDGGENNENIMTTTKGTTVPQSTIPTTSAIISSNPCTPDHHKKQHSKRKYENEVMRNTLTSRFAEIQPEWTQYRNELNEELISLDENLNNLDEKRKQIKNDEEKRDLLTRQLAMIREVETLGTAMSSHPLNTLSQRYNSYKITLDEFNNVKDILYEKTKEYELKYESYYEFLKIQLNNENMLRELQLELDDISQIQIDNEFDLIKEFLENFNEQNNDNDLNLMEIYTQADQARKELDVSFIQQSFIIKVALENLGQYLNIIQFCPRSYMKKHRLLQYTNFCKKLLNNPDSYQDIVQEFDKIKSNDTLVDEVTERAIPYALELNKLWIEMDFNLRKSFDLLNNESPEYNEQYLKESHEAITNFIQLKNGAKIAIQNEFISNVCDLTENYIIFEETCSKTVKEMLLPNLNGILDEYYTFLIQIIETTKIIFLNNTEFLTYNKIYFDTLNIICNTIQSFRDIENLFQIQIIPKIIRLFMEEDLNVIKCFNDFIDLINFIDFDSTLNKLNNNWNCDEIDLLKISYERIKRSINDNSTFNNLMIIIDQIFITTYKNLEDCFNAIMNLPQNETYMEKLDHVIRSKAIMNPVKDNHSINLLLQRFELRKYHAFSQFISISKQITIALKENNLQMIYDIRTILHPITSFIGDCLLELTIGYGSYVSALLEIQIINSITSNFIHFNSTNIKSIVLSLIEHNLSGNIYSTDIYSYSKTLCLNLNVSIKKRLFIENIKRLIVIQTENFHHFGFICNSHAWLNEKILLKQNQFSYIISKNHILQNFQNAIQNLNAWQLSINKITEELIIYKTSILQYLKNLSIIKNSNLFDLQKSFNDISLKQDHKYHENMKISLQILNYCQIIIKFEKLRTNINEINENDENFLYFIKNFNKIYNSYKNSSNHITPVEEAIVQLLDPEGIIDHYWINNISDLLDDMTDNIQQKIAKHEKNLYEIQENLQIIAQKLKNLMEHEVRIDIRNLLKLISKVDGVGGGGGGGGGGYGSSAIYGSQVTRYKQFQNDYKQFLMKINDLQMKISNKDFSDENVKEIRDLIKKLQIELEDIYKEFLNLIAERNDLDARERRDGSEGKIIGNTKDGKKGNQSEQKRNAYAVSVWRRIRMKLEGRDPDQNRRLTISEQVDWMIREAMNPDNLAVLYEGWTPWV